MAGSKGKVVIWNLADNAVFKRTFPPAKYGVEVESKEDGVEVLRVESDGEVSEDEETEDEEMSEDGASGMDESTDSDV